MEKSLDLCSNFQLKKCLYGRRLHHEDRISSLSDEILLLIMSFLSFKEVVKTSLISRRWLNLWVHTPVLDIPVNLWVHTPVLDVLDIPDPFPITNMERGEYIKWVNHVLRRHKCPYLEEFKIVCHLDNCNQKDIERWLVFAFSKKVERLELNLLGSGCFYPANLRDNFVFPGWFHDLNGVKGVSDGGKSRFTQFDFNCLKSLSLKRVDVTGEAINSILLNCPFLEQLEVVGTLKLFNLVISNPNLSLKYLKIEYCNNLKLLRISNFNLVSLDIPPIINLTLTNLPMLVELSIQGTSEALSLSLSRPSSCFSQLEAFVLMGFNLEDVSQLSNAYQLAKLKRLVINVRAPGDESLNMFISIIHSCPQLEQFVMKVGGFKREWATPSRIINEVERRGSSVKSKSLKVFEFFGYYGRDRDIELIMHVADNIVGLEKIIIHLTGISTTGAEEMIARNIALHQLDSLRKFIPPHVHLLIR